MSHYASQTTVPAERSRAEIEQLLRKYGADAFSSGWVEKQARIQFRLKGRIVRFVLPMPDPKSDAFRHTKTGRWRSPGQRSDRMAEQAYEQAVRQRWRALCLVVKAKIEAVESGITTFEEEFMPFIVMPDGKTVAEHALPAISAAYESGQMPALLPGW